MELIAIHHLSKRYGKTEVLRDLSVTYEPGMIYGLAGENGAGKTTLFNCVMGLTSYEGEIRKPAHLSVGYLPAENHFYTLVTVWSIWTFVSRPRGKAWKRSRKSTKSSSCPCEDMPRSIPRA